MNTSFTEENYLKTIFKLAGETGGNVSTNAIADALQTKASSVTDMIKKLCDKKFLHHTPYQGVLLSLEGKNKALQIIRKHRLWEVFLVEKLHFSWDEVHEIAEELEHIKSEKLINKLDAFLEFPAFDPHGDPIPDVNGDVKKVNKLLLSDSELNKEYRCIGVKDSSSDFLKYLDKQKIALGSTFLVKEKEVFDDTLLVEVNAKEISISHKIANNLYVH
jgi:DtxR family Mn-dependent transcriptional regulator